MTHTRTNTFIASLALGASLLTLSALPTVAEARGYHHSQTTVVYFTRHAEKKTTTEVVGQNESPLRGEVLREVCGIDKCAEELSDLGLLRADYLADWFARWGITSRITHAYSSHKTRTLQTIRMIAADAGLSGDVDLIADGVQQLPADGTELAPESTSPSVDPTVNAINDLPGGSTAIIAGHSGSLYKIFNGLGINTDNDRRFPKDAKGKVRDFGDIWKIVIRNGKARLVYRINLQPGALRLNY